MGSGKVDYSKKELSKPKLGISTCLLGENVRYDGQHKLDRYLRDTLGRFVEWVPVCPEVECGLGVPREAMRLVGESDSPRLMTIRTEKDLTNQMLSWCRTKIEELRPLDLRGYVFKANSPSSGMRQVKVYNAKGIPSKTGVGLFANAFMRAFPHIPVEDEGRLHDAEIRENFIERVFVYHRWREYVENDHTPKGLVDFHSDHKLLLMSHSPKLLRELGNIVSSGGKKHGSKTDDYLSKLMPCLGLKATVKKNVNVLQHALGYFKKLLSHDEKAEMLDIFNSYHAGLVPLIAPVTLLNHHVRKYSISYLERQVYLRPHPLELMLRNHV